MHRRYRLSVLLLIIAALLTACGGSSKATDTPPPAPSSAAAAASSATTATRPASSVTGSSVAGTTAPTAAAGSAASGTRPASSAITSSTVAAGSASAIVGTRPAGSATGSIIPGGTTAAGSSAAGAGVTLFTDPKGRFSFSRPAAWTVGQSTSADSVVQFNATNPPGVLDISTESVPASATPETYRAAALAEIMKAIPDAQQVGTLSLQLDTEPAIQIDYTGTVSGNKIYFSQIFSLHKGTAYVLTLGTQPADIDKMKQQAIVLVQTWKFLQ